MDFNEYQKQALTTANFSNSKLLDEIISMLGVVDNRVENHLSILDEEDEDEPCLFPYTGLIRATQETLQKQREQLDIYYCTTGIGGEAGETLEKIKKSVRNQKGYIPSESEVQEARESGAGFYLFGDIKVPFDKIVTKELIKLELGDVFWYIANLAFLLFGENSLNEIAEMNIDKLAKRKQNGTIKSAGDER